VLADTLFSYKCNACGRCCRNQVITLSPYDIVRLARSAQLSTTEAIARFTLRRGSLLRFEPDGQCKALDGPRCTLHSGRPMACRLYPLGVEFTGTSASFIRLEPAAGSAGVYGIASTVADFLCSQEIAPYLTAIERYRSLVPLMRARIAALIDFDQIEPREFWRRAFHEAMRETNYDPNPLIAGIFDADSAVGANRYDSELELIDAHLDAIAKMIRGASDPSLLAAAALLLAVSLGYSPGEVIAGNQSN
jgi:Fe-S-cluster containining protein